MMDKQDVISAEDRQPYTRQSQWRSNIKFDDAFYSKVNKGSGSLPEFDKYQYEHAGTENSQPVDRRRQQSAAEKTTGTTNASTAAGADSNRTTPATTTADGASNRPTDASGTRPTDASATRPTDASGTRPTDASGTRPTDASATRPTDASATRPTDASATRPTDASATRPTDAAAAAQPANLHDSARLTKNADGSADTTVKPGDNLWRIAREALKQNKPEDYKPSDRDVQDAVRRIAQENHLRNPNLIHPNDKIHIPKELIAKPPEVQAPTETRHGPEVPVEVRNASPEFAAEVKRQFDSLPENVRRLLADSGNKIVVGGKISDADPDLRGVTPRGWPPGTTWDDDDGLYNPGKKEITVAETHHDRDTDRFVTNPRVEGSIKHESGHAVDAALGSMSHSDDFKNAFDADVARMSEADKARFSYLLQGGHAGHEETFAEVFGAMHGSSANADQTQAILNDFPSVRALIQRRLAQLP